MSLHAVTEHRAQLGEGPFWDVPTQALYWVNIAGKQGAHTPVILHGPLPPAVFGHPVVMSGAGENITLGGAVIE